MLDHICILVHGLAHGAINCKGPPSSSQQLNSCRHVNALAKSMTVVTYWLAIGGVSAAIMPCRRRVATRAARHQSTAYICQRS
eukprot:366229-Chlamydomonas_euryale.AAC.3